MHGRLPSHGGAGAASTRLHASAGSTARRACCWSPGSGAVWVEGELSNLARPASGHWYFSLKDEQAQVRCAMFRQRNRLARFTPRDGQQVLARGRVSLYEARGDYQLIVEHLEEAGEGALQRAFEELQATPRRRGPVRAGAQAPAAGAAAAHRRHHLAHRRRAARHPAHPARGASRPAAVLIYPVPVQGAAAAPAIVARAGRWPPRATNATC